MRTGILGGTFDPIHIGHLILAETILSDFRLDRILFIPAKEAPHKIGFITSDSTHRLEMLRLALKDQPAFRISDCEILRHGPSYTVDTIDYLKKTDDYRSDIFFLILGMDNLVDFFTWKDPDRLLEIVSIICLNRPGFKENQINPELMNRVHRLQTPIIDVSATEIRRRVKKGLSVRYWTPQTVAEYIASHGLYL